MSLVQIMRGGIAGGGGWDVSCKVIEEDLGSASWDEILPQVTVANEIGE